MDLADGVVNASRGSRWITHILVMVVAGLSMLVVVVAGSSMLVVVVAGVVNASRGSRWGRQC